MTPDRSQKEYFIMTSSVIYQLKEIDAATLKQSMDKNEVLLIDVRETSEFAAEHIPGAKLMPLSKFELGKIPTDSGKQIVLHCQSGNRSAKAAEKMFAGGFREIIHLGGGLPTWKAAGYPTQLSQKAPISMFRQVQIVAGSLVFLGTVLGAFVSPWFLILSGFVGAGLVFAGVTDTCMMALLLAKLPYNQPKVSPEDMLL